MTREEAYSIWDEIDNYRYGSISSSSLQRWLQDFADFNLPFEETHYLYDCFDVRESEGKINEAQFVNSLAGPQEDEPDQIQEQTVQEGDDFNRDEPLRTAQEQQ